MLVMDKTPSRPSPGSWFLSTGAMIPSPSGPSIRRSPAIASLVQGGRRLTQRLHTFMEDSQATHEGFELVGISKEKHTMLSNSPSGASLALAKSPCDSPSTQPHLEPDFKKVRRVVQQTNYLLSIANAMKCKQLQHKLESQEQQLEDLRRISAEQKAVIDSLRKVVAGLTAEGRRQAVRCQQLEVATQTGHKLLSAALQETHRALQEHAAILSQQQAVLNRCMQRPPQDSLVDVACFVVSARLVHMPLAEVATQWLEDYLQDMIPKHRHKKWLHQVLRLVIFIQIFLLIRAATTKLQISRWLWSSIRWMFMLPKHTWNRLRPSNTAPPGASYPRHKLKSDFQP